MQNIKRIIGAICICFFCGHISISAQAEEVSLKEDFLVDADWPEIPVEVERRPLRYLADQKVITGDINGLADPYQILNRAQFIKILILSTNKPVSKECLENPESSNFPDVSISAWYAPYVCEAKMRGIVTGYPDGAFRPNDFVNLSTGSKLIVQTFFPNINADYDKFWFQPYLEKLFQENLIPSRIINHWGFEQNFGLPELAEIIYTIKTGKFVEVIQPTTFSEFERRQSGLPIEDIDKNQEIKERIFTLLQTGEEVREISDPQLSYPRGILKSQVWKFFELGDIRFALSFRNTIDITIFVEEFEKRGVENEPYYLASWSGVLIAEGGETQWEKLYEIQDTNEFHNNDPFYLWSENENLFLSVVDTNGAGSGDGHMKIFLFTEQKTWDMKGCYYYMPPFSDINYLHQKFSSTMNTENFAPLPIVECQDTKVL